MDVPQNEEVGFKRLTLSASDYNASVPIKKRRFPLFQSPPSPSPSPSPPRSKEMSSLPLDENLVEKKQQPLLSEGPTVLSQRPTVLSEGPTVLSEGPTVSNDSMVTTSELQEKNKFFVSEESEKKFDSLNAKMTWTNTRPSRIKFEEGDACSNGYVKYEEKSVVNEGVVLQVLPEKPELKLSTTSLNPRLESGANNKSFEIGIEKLEEKCDPSVSCLNKQTELSVSFEGTEVKCQKQNDLEPVLLNLCLSKQGSGSQCVAGNAGSDYDRSLSQSNRENWDLNTSMESWEDCASTAHTEQVSVAQTSTIVTAHGFSSEMLETDSTAVKRSLHLSLSSSDLKPMVSREQDSSVKLDLGTSNSCLSSAGRDMQLADINIDKKGVKLEPFVEGSKLDVNNKDKVIGFGLSRDAVVKHELDDRCHLEAPISLNTCSSTNVAKPKTIKSEGIHVNQPEALKTFGGTLNREVENVPQESDNSVPLAMTVMAEMIGTASDPCSTDLGISRDTSNHSGQLSSIEGQLDREMHEMTCDGGRLVKLEMINKSKDSGSKDSAISAVETSAEDENLNNSEWCPSKVMNEHGLQGGERSCVSDEEKINISADMLEEDSYGSDYESDGNQDVSKAVDTVHNNTEEDYEDGEVREPMLKTEVVKNVCEKREVERFDHGVCDDKKINSVGLPRLAHFSGASVEQEGKSESLGVKSEAVNTITKVKSPRQQNEGFCSKELRGDVSSIKELNKPIKATGGRQFSSNENRVVREDQNISPDKATGAVVERVVTVSEGVTENVKTVDSVQNEALSNIQDPVNVDNAGQDVHSGSRQRRIINLSQTSSSNTKTRCNLVRSILSRTDRELVPDVEQEGGEAHPQGRDEMYTDPQKIAMDRHQNPSPQMGFNRRRGRVNRRFDPRHGEWNFDPDFSPGVYNDQMEYSAPRHQYNSTVSEDELDQNNFKMAPDGPFGSGCRRGRQILEDEGPLFCHMPSRRKSPGGRDGPPVRGVKMVHRMPRSISPNRCMGKPDPEMVRRQNSDKFMRNFGDETMDPMYGRPQPPYEVDRPPFSRDRRNFSIQRKGFPRFDSKSPGRSRARSPGQWFPPKRRSDGFCGHPEMPRQSSPGYRMDRMRSPDQPPLRGEMAVRSHGFPPVMGSARDHGHVRPFIPNRNHSGRSFRNRRFDVMDPRDRIESNNDYFGGPVHSGQMNELSGDSSDEERRRFGNGHEPHHSFRRPPFNDCDGEGFHNNAEGEREFDRRVNNPPGNLHRRPRVVEEHEDNYRRGRQMWNDHGFDDMSRVKRKRF